MSHPHEALLQAHLDGELAPPEMRDVSRHIATCDGCRQASEELASLSYSFSEMVGRLDDAEPLEWRAAALLPGAPALATHGGSTPGLAAGPRLVLERPARARSLVAWRWAAAALLMVTGVAAAAVVRGPLSHGSTSALTNAAVAPPAALPAALQPAGAIAIAPRRGTAEVALTGAAGGSRLRIAITSGSELTVSVRSDSASAEPARFRTSDTRIAVQLPDAVALVDVEVPAATQTVRVLVSDSVVATVKHGRVTPAEAAMGGIALGPHP